MVTAVCSIDVGPIEKSYAPANIQHDCKKNCFNLKETRISWMRIFIFIASLGPVSDIHSINDEGVKSPAFAFMRNY